MTAATRIINLLKDSPPLNHLEIARNLNLPAPSVRRTVRELELQAEVYSETSWLTGRRLFTVPESL
jgi:DNA-binding IclR family transcriptional regulator